VATHTRHFFLASQALTNNALDATKRKEKKKKHRNKHPLWNKICIHMSHKDEHQRRKATSQHHHHHPHQSQQQKQQQHLATNPLFLAPSLFLLLLCLFCLLSIKFLFLWLLVLFIGRRLKSADEQKEITYPPKKKNKL
jgi:hypothetical protein